MLEDFIVDRMLDMLLPEGGGRERVESSSAVVAAAASKRKPNPEKGSVLVGVCSSDSDMFLEEMPVGRLWDMLLPVLGVVAECMLVAMVV
jgi:hypothetical protein